MAVKKTPPKPPAKRAAKAAPAPAKKVAKPKGGAKALDPTSRSSQRIARHTEGNLSNASKARADRFVLQYLRDFNATQAFIRMSVEEGREFEDISYDYAMNKGYEMTRWPYVAQRVDEAKQEAEEENILANRDVLWGIRKEMNFHGSGASHGARVSALALAAKVKGMEAPRKVEASVALRGGIMIVPETQDLASWEERAAMAQASLKEEVRK